MRLSVEVCKCEVLLLLVRYSVASVRMSVAEAKRVDDSLSLRRLGGGGKMAKS